MVKKKKLESKKLWNIDLFFSNKIKNKKISLISKLIFFFYVEMWPSSYFFSFLLFFCDFLVSSFKFRGWKINFWIKIKFSKTKRMGKKLIRNRWIKNYHFIWIWDWPLYFLVWSLFLLIVYFYYKFKPRVIKFVYYQKNSI